MSAIYVPKHFIVQEVVPPSIYTRFGQSSWWFIDSRIMQAADRLRERFGPITVNNWHDGGSYVSSGFRLPNAEGSPLSQHKYGRALDVKAAKATPEEVWEYIISNRREFPTITCIENIKHTPSWVHIDCRYHQEGATIKIVNP